MTVPDYVARAAASYRDNRPPMPRDAASAAYMDQWGEEREIFDPDRFPWQRPSTPLADARKQAKEVPPFRLDDPTLLHDKEPPPRHWIAEKYIPAFVPTLMMGDSGIGKTLAMLQLGVSVATLQLWLGIPTIRGKVWMITAEDDFDELHRRLRDVSRDTGVELSHFEDLRIRSMAGEDSLLAYPIEKGRVRPTPLWQSIEKRISDERPDPVIFDPLSDYFGGNENDRVETKQFMNLSAHACRNHRTTIIKTGHPSRAGMASGSGESGSTGWKAACRSMLYMKRPDGDDSDPDQRVIEHKKANYGALQPDIKVRWRDGAFTVAPKTDDSKAFGQHSKAERVVLEMLAAYAEEGRDVSPKPSANYLPAVFAKDKRAQGVTKQALVGAMNDLFARKEIETKTVGYQSRLRQSVAIVQQAGAA